MFTNSDTFVKNKFIHNSFNLFIDPSPFTHENNFIFFFSFNGKKAFQVVCELKRIRGRRRKRQLQRNHLRWRVASGISTISGIENESLEMIQRRLEKQQFSQTWIKKASTFLLWLSCKVVYFFCVDVLCYVLEIDLSHKFLDSVLTFCVFSSLTFLLTSRHCRVFGFLEGFFDRQK